jgi:hypothetical protein
MEKCCGPLAVEIIPGKHCVFSTNLAKRAQVQSGACSEVQFPDYGTVLWSTGSRNDSRKTAISAPILPREREISLAHAQRCNFLIIKHCCGPLAVEIVPGMQESSAISAPILPRERELSFAHAQRYSFLIMEQISRPLTVEIVPGKHCDFSTNLPKRATAQSGACAEVHFPDYGTELWSPGSRNVPGKHCDYSTYLAKRARAQPGACAEVQFPDYGRVLWSPGGRNCSRKAGKNCDFST